MLNTHHIRTRGGFTLAEVLVVVAIVGILVVAFGASFIGWQGTYKIEAEIKKINSDLMQAKALAMQHKRTVFFFAVGGGNKAETYRIYEDTNPAPDGDGALQTGTDDLITNTTLERFDYYLYNGAGGTEGQFRFNSKGLTYGSGGGLLAADSPYRLVLRAKNFDAGDSDTYIYADYDCIALSATRLNVGISNVSSLSPTTCDEK